MAVLLMVTLSSALAAPLFAFSTKREGNLPACCRKNGKHHCMMLAMAMDPSMKQVAAFGERCSHFPKATTAVGNTIVFIPTTAVFYAEILSHPARSPQTEAHYRISFDRARQKRGPPLQIL
jgi:hypothetical protein